MVRTVVILSWKCGTAICGLGDSTRRQGQEFRVPGHAVRPDYRPAYVGVANPCEIPVNTRIFTWKSY
ncbi:hypothetical protein BST43_08965 [Mycobacteroides saopaulense]|uniref:Uncharacterized protein n=1 Tax=Mycobacteroides saopaulense TaxID=1578165 RepID=A0A1X0J8S8_9MYCO|nr:hypothetical protein BST43_08965 [Mycobacteroides saopaulense]